MLFLTFPLWASWFKKITSLSLRQIMLKPSRKDPWSFTVLGVSHEMPSEGKIEWKFSRSAVCIWEKTTKGIVYLRFFPLAAGWPQIQAKRYWAGRPRGHVQPPSCLVLWHHKIDVAKWGSQSENSPEGVAHVCMIYLLNRVHMTVQSYAKVKTS